MGRTRQPGGEPTRARRRPEPAADPVVDPAVDPVMQALLDDVRTTRIHLAADLSAAAGALDDGHAEVARDIVAGDIEDVAAFRALATARLAAEPAPVVVPRPRTRSRRTRVLLALPAVPLVGALAMTTAAAIGGGTHPATHHASRPAAAAAAAPKVRQTPATTATSTLQRLEHVVRHHAASTQVIAVADDLHNQLTQMLTTSTTNPSRLGVVKRLLTVEQNLLKVHSGPGVTLALEASRHLVQLLDNLTAPLATLTQSTKLALTLPTPTHPTAHKSASPDKSATSTSTQHKQSAQPTHHKHASTAKPTPTSSPTNLLLVPGLFHSVL